MNSRHIDTDNYEEFFLLYMDNELTAEERVSVESFLEGHPELRPELQRLMGTRLDPDNVSFEGRETLLRAEGFPGPWNIGELQMLWLDDELDADTAARVEDYSRAHPQAAEDLELLKKARLIPEPVVFPDKASLYRHDKKPAPLLPLLARRMAAAAAVLLAVGLFWISREDGSSLPGVSLSAEVKAPPAAEKPLEPRLGIQDEMAVVQKAEAQASGTRRKAETGPAEKYITDQPVTIPPQDRTTYAAALLPAQETDAGVSEMVKSDAAPAPIVQDEEEKNGRDMQALHVKNDYATEALTGGEERRDPENMWDGQKQRKGLRGFVRKVNRFYNKATNPDPGSSMVRVANFEIGLPR